MTTIRDITETPGMPSWVRVSIGLLGLAFCRAAATFAQPMIEAGWQWTHGTAALVMLALGVDLLHSGARKRWPLILFSDLLIARLFNGRWR